MSLIKNLRELKENRTNWLFFLTSFLPVHLPGRFIACRWVVVISGGKKPWEIQFKSNIVESSGLEAQIPTLSTLESLKGCAPRCCTLKTTRSRQGGPDLQQESCYQPYLQVSSIHYQQANASLWGKYLVLLVLLNNALPHTIDIGCHLPHQSVKMRVSDFMAFLLVRSQRYEIIKNKIISYIEIKSNT